MFFQAIDYFQLNNFCLKQVSSAQVLMGKTNEF